MSDLFILASCLVYSACYIQAAVVRTSSGASDPEIQPKICDSLSAAKTKNKNKSTNLGSIFINIDLWTPELMIGEFWLENHLLRENFSQGSYSQVPILKSGPANQNNLTFAERLAILVWVQIRLVMPNHYEKAWEVRTPIKLRCIILLTCVWNRSSNYFAFPLLSWFAAWGCRAVCAREQTLHTHNAHTQHTTHTYTYTHTRQHTEQTTHTTQTHTHTQTRDTHTHTNTPHTDITHTHTHNMHIHHAHTPHIWSTHTHTQHTLHKTNTTHKTHKTQNIHKRNTHTHIMPNTQHTHTCAQHIQAHTHTRERVQDWSRASSCGDATGRPSTSQTWGHQPAKTGGRCWKLLTNCCTRDAQQATCTPWPLKDIQFLCFDWFHRLSIGCLRGHFSPKPSLNMSQQKKTAKGLNKNSQACPPLLPKRVPKYQKWFWVVVGRCEQYFIVLRRSVW